MQNKVKISVIILVLLISIFILFSDQGSAGLDTVIRNAIMVAYMNGYAEALQLTMDEISILKTNEKLFRQRIEQAAAAYIITVENMNK
jgi:5-bromo-4-chloroindolyl phosphate hydrolysis protein